MAMLVLKSMSVLLFLYRKSFHCVYSPAILMSKEVYSDVFGCMPEDYDSHPKKNRLLDVKRYCCYFDLTK